MVARGDLGVEMPAEKVPSIQRLILRTARVVGKPVVVATQMLESMIEAPTPTRAEASDVATAVYEGADAVMLSAESAAGRYPVEAVRVMDRIIAEVEQDPYYRRGHRRGPSPSRAHCGRPHLPRAAPGRRRAAGEGDRGLHDLGLDRAPGSARPARRPDPGLDTGRAYRAPLVPGLGPLRRAHPRGEPGRGDGRACLRDRRRRGPGRAGRAHRHRRRDAVRGRRAAPTCSGSNASRRARGRSAPGFS